MIWFVGGLIVLGGLAVPEMVWAGRLESIAAEIAGGSSKKIRQLTEIGITASLFIPLLVMLYWATEKKGSMRVAGYIGAIALAGALYVLHFT